jgi:cytochrome c oxidase subunit 3/cytochrome o ubiquinol oxidase subunit 3
MLNERAMTMPAMPAEWRLPSPRKVAVACLILTESAMFSIFVTAYLFYIGKSLNGPYPSQVLEIPIISTICLLGSSLTIVLAERSLRQENRGRFQMWWMVTIVLALVFLGGTASEWYRLITVHHLTINTNLFGATFYSLVGLHATHVVAGLTLLILVLVVSLRRRLKNTHHEHVQMISWYWHFVDAVWVVVFTSVYIIGR